MDSSQLAALGTTVIRISVFMLYALVGAICWRKLFLHLSPTARRMAGILFLAQLLVIAMALRDQPSSLFERWLWDVHEEGNVPSTLASTQLVLAAAAALLSGWLARGRHAAERAYFFALAVIFAFIARDEYISLHEHIDNWERYYITLGLVVAAASAPMAARSSGSQRLWHICLLIGLGMSAIGAIAFEANPQFCGRWDFLPLDGCQWAAHYEESLEFLGIWLVLLALLGQLSAQPGASDVRVRFALYILPPLWILLLLSNAWLPRLESALLAQPAEVAYESGLRLQGYRLDKGKEGAAVWLYVAAKSQDYFDIGYTILLVDQASGAVHAETQLAADTPVGFLIAPDYNHVYRQRLDVSYPPEMPAGEALQITLQLWREHDGDLVYARAVASDHEVLDDTQVVLGELTGSAGR